MRKLKVRPEKRKKLLALDRRGREGGVPRDSCYYTQKERKIEASSSTLPLAKRRKNKAHNSANGRLIGPDEGGLLICRHKDAFAAVKESRNRFVEKKMGRQAFLSGNSQTFSSKKETLLVKVNTLRNFPITQRSFFCLPFVHEPWQCCHWCFRKEREKLLLSLLNRPEFKTVGKSGFLLWPSASSNQYLSNTPPCFSLLLLLLLNFPCVDVDARFLPCNVTGRNCWS